MLLTASIAAPCGVNFVGSLNIHVAHQPLPFELIFALLILGWLTVATCFYITGVFVSKSKIRAVDVYGTFALVRAPFLIAALDGFLLGTWYLDPQRVQTPEFWVFGVIALLVAILVVVWSYNAFAVSANVKNKWLFTGIFIVSEIIAMILSGTMAVWIMQRPIDVKQDNPAVLVVIAPDVVDSAKAQAPEDAERIEIAKKFIEWVFANAGDDPLEQFQAIDEMKQFMTAARFRFYSQGITDVSGKLGDCAKVEVVQHDQRLRSVYLFFHGERRPVKMWVTLGLFSNLCSALLRYF